MTLETPQYSRSSWFSRLAGFDCAQRAVQQVFRQQPQLSVADLSLLELHDCFSVNECMLYEALGLCDSAEVSRGDDHEGEENIFYK